MTAIRTAQARRCPSRRQTSRTPLDLTDLELETAARACPARARQEEQAAKRIANPGMRGPIENTVKRAAALTEKFEAARSSQEKHEATEWGESFPSAT